MGDSPVSPGGLQAASQSRSLRLRPAALMPAWRQRPRNARVAATRGWPALEIFDRKRTSTGTRSDILTGAAARGDPGRICVGAKADQLDESASPRLLKYW